MVNAIGMVQGRRMKKRRTRLPRKSFRRTTASSVSEDRDDHGGEDGVDQRDPDGVAEGGIVQQVLKDLQPDDVVLEMGNGDAADRIPEGQTKRPANQREDVDDRGAKIA